MRHMVYGILAGLLLTIPAAAQSGSSATTPSKTPQDQAAKDNKSADQASKPAQVTGDPAAPAAAPQEAKEDPLANFNILGNAVGDGLGVPR